MKTLFIYTTAGCHLCEQAAALVAPELPRYGLVLESIEIANSDELMECYGVRIPVFRIEDETRELGWPFSREAFIAFLEGREPTSGEDGQAPTYP